VSRVSSSRVDSQCPSRFPSQLHSQSQCICTISCPASFHGLRSTLCPGPSAPWFRSGLSNRSNPCPILCCAPTTSEATALIMIAPTSSMTGLIGLTEGRGERAELARGTTHLVRYHLVEQWVKLGWAEVL
jgi:hypothetical protein